jgi:hypothetical protein
MPTKQSRFDDQCNKTRAYKQTASILTPCRAVQDAVLALPQLISNNNRFEFLQFHGVLSAKPSQKNG